MTTDKRDVQSLHGTFGDSDIVIRDADRDSLSALPLAIIPLETPALQRVRLVKNNSLEGVVEMFEDASTGSGHVHPKSLYEAIPSVTGLDTEVVKKLASLHSYDVYSLRISLRDAGINVNDVSFLKLSSSKQEELSVYMRPFIQRLIVQIYGGGADVGSTTDITTLFHDPDVKVARQKLTTISSQLSIALQDVPGFLEDYGDVYLSIAYYRQCLDTIAPTIDDFVTAMNDILKHDQLKQNPDLIKVAKRLQAKVLKLQSVLDERFRIFSQSTQEMWQDMNADRFGEFRTLVEDNHAALGGLLCALSVKMNAWASKFPSRHSAGPNRWADFVMTDMRQGM